MKPFRTTHTEQKFCPFCGKQNPTTYKYCIDCGYEIPDISFIPQKSNIQTRSDIEQNQPSQTIIYAPTVEKKRGYGRLIFFLAVATLFIYTNPSEKMHLDYVCENIRTEMINKSSQLGSVINIFDAAVGYDAINSYLTNSCKRTNYIFFSLTKIQVSDKKEILTLLWWSDIKSSDLGDKKEILTIGILGNVFVWEEMENSFDRLRIKYDL